MVDPKRGYLRESQEDEESRRALGGALPTETKKKIFLKRNLNPLLMPPQEAPRITM
ncbi:hypothetical protein PPTG_21461 [Phytophthora nicotianae INRA-310]|uniref:Uncharacterized protein n=1 Tax=Phytophthora nicotianae (strain INRA-310) TaxID=761204 RepID=W2R1Z2_PHYN3|nr:hypothetical protein PPTG_21461 [Phytophthora nicotianae INRA-310]ETN19457.1 hypothetical protein PPTG_21461 [Phytophthora nicotianae INRA-310]